MAEEQEAKEESVLVSFLLTSSRASLRAGERPNGPVTYGSRMEENALAERQGALHPNELEPHRGRPGRGSKALAADAPMQAQALTLSMQRTRVC